MNPRKNHKNRLQALLQLIAYQGANLVASDHYLNTSEQYPYLFITSGNLSLSFLQNHQYDYKYNYNINLVFRFDKDIAQQDLETQIDDLETLIVTQLASPLARDGQGWLDCTVTNVTAPFQDDMMVKNNVVYKTFSVTVRDTAEFA